ncbi:hypothetical protein ACFOQM_00885, partial [Paenibacillus sp. GCM10012307]|nr:hypothetical protein [Paenibacillus roseus]
AYVKNEPVMYDDPTGHFFNFVAAAVGAAAGAAIGAGIEMARDAAKGQLSKSNWKKYAGAAAAGAITGLTAGLTGGASLVANMGVRAGAGYASSAAEQYITTGKVNQKQALMSSVQSVGTYGAGKATNKLKVSSGGSGGTGTGKGLETRGYKPQAGERNLEGYVKKNVPIDKETKLYTKSSGFNNVGQSGGQFKRYGSDSHANLSPHVHQPQRNVDRSGNVRGSVGSKTKNGGVASPTKKDISQLYDNLNNGKYRP